MRINHNIPALNAYRNLSIANSANAKSMEKLSSGLRINRAADDAAGLAISETMRGQIRGLNQASRNAQDAISLLQTAEGALTETHSILHRMRELSVQAANDTYTSNDRQEIQKEVDQLKDEIDRIANTTNFNNKNLLDGTASALTSTDKLSTKVFMRGGLRLVDQFGQKTAGAGNYKLDIEATAGKAQIQKSDLFKNNHAGNTVQELAIDEAQGIDHLSAEDLAIGKYHVSSDANRTAAAANATANVGTTFLASNSTAASFFTTMSVADVSATVNASVLMEIVDGGRSGDVMTSVVMSVSWYQYDQSGNYMNTAGTYDGSGEIQLFHTQVTLSNPDVDTGTVIDLGAFSLNVDMVSQGAVTGNKVTINLRAAASAAQALDEITVSFNNDLAATAADVTNTAVDWFINDDQLNNRTVNMYFFTLDQSGNVGSGHMDLTIGGIADAVSGTSFTFNEGLGKVASLDTKLRDIDKFWDASGKFLLDDPQTLTLIQGDGQKFSFTIYGEDTIRDVVNKLNDAIGTGLGQKDLVGAGDIDKFVSYVTKADSSGFETVAGTFVIRSAKAGKDGEINIIGNEQIVNALSLADVQQSTESQFKVNVTNAHDPTQVIAKDVQISGNMLIGVVHPNVDVKFDSNADIVSTWNAQTKGFDLTGDTTKTYSTFVHLVDNTQVFQIGANEMQDMGAAIGNMNAEALGVKNILVTDRASAARSITVLDNAISRVSSQRSSLGAVQNRLEHTINNLGVASENLTAAESRIRDVDMATEMMEFSKLNILAQASTAMLAQANQQPQMVLQLLGR